MFSLLAVAVASSCSAEEERTGIRRGAEPDVITVATFNIHHGRGADGRLDLARVERAIRDSGADIIGLQEVDRHFDPRSAFADQVAVLGEAFGMESAFGPTLDLPPPPSGTARRQYGNALLSRYPIVWNDNTLLPAATSSEPRAVLRAGIDVPGAPLEVVVTHLEAFSASERYDQAVALRSSLEDPPSRTVVLADLNAVPGSEEAVALAAGLQDAWAVVGDGDGWTYPASEPGRRIDQVLVSPDLQVHAARVPTTDSSDHRPVVVELIDGSGEGGDRTGHSRPVEGRSHPRSARSGRSTPTS